MNRIGIPQMKIEKQHEKLWNEFDVKFPMTTTAFNTVLRHREREKRFMESPQSSTNHHFLSVYFTIYRTECKLSSIVYVKDRCMVEGNREKTIMSNKYHNINNSNKQQTSLANEKVESIRCES